MDDGRLDTQNLRGDIAPGPDDRTGWQPQRHAGRRALGVIATALVALLACAPAALAAYRCVPNQDPRCSAQRVYPTIQAAIEAASRNDVILLGPATLAERVIVTKNLRFQCRPGAIVTDEGLPPGAALVTYRGKSVKPQYWRGCTFNVATSTVGINVPFTTGHIKLEKVTLTRLGDRAGVGILIDGSGGAPHARNVLLDEVVIANFDVGARVINARGLNFEPVTFIGNGIGAHLTNAAGQTFYNTYIGNDIGLIWEAGGPGAPRFNNLDNNGNTFRDNGIALWLGKGLHNVEFHFNDITYTEPWQIAFHAETAAGTFVDGDTAYRHGVACGSAGFASNTVNGVRYDPATWWLEDEC